MPVVFLKVGTYKRREIRQLLDENGLETLKLPNVGKLLMVVNPQGWHSYRISKERILVGDNHKYVYVIRILSAAVQEKSQ